jgi:hypothetical protein
MHRIISRPLRVGFFFACAADGGWIFEWKFDFHFVSENGKSSNPLNGGWQWLPVGH